MAGRNIKNNADWFSHDADASSDEPVMLDITEHIWYSVCAINRSSGLTARIAKKGTSSLFNGPGVESASSQVFLFGPVCQSTFGPFLFLTGQSGSYFNKKDFKMDKTAKKIATIIQKSKYSVIASGYRDVSFDELKVFIKIIRFSSEGNIQRELENLFKNDPQTIAIDRASKERNCENFDEIVCDCFLPGVDFENCYCQIKRKEFLHTTDYRNTPEYQEWRKSVFERDRYTCADCGWVGGDLNAHHIETFKDHPSRRYDIENGTTLCVECHKNRHRKGR
jgi:hypothetical protein